MFFQKRKSLLFALLLAPLLLRATDSLTVEDCRRLALENSPLQQKKQLAAQVSALQTENIRSNSLPRINVGAQATWQSEVFGLPFSFPGSEPPVVPKDQYKLSLDVAERLYDGGSDRFLRQQRALEKDIAAAQTDVDVHQVRELVTDLFFKTLLLQETENVLLTSKTDLETRLKQAEAMVTEGVALRTTADLVRIQILKTEQQIESVRADKKALLETLGVWIDKSDFVLLPTPPKPVSAGLTLHRPEYRLFSLQQRNLLLARDMLDLKRKPKVEAFVQGGFGRPNPFNFFETGFEPFALVGVRAAWTPWDWGNRKRDAQVLEIQLSNFAILERSLEQRLQAQAVKDRSDVAKAEAALRQDDAIIALQEDIIRRADAQVKNGVMTMTDYLAQVSILTQARLTRKQHEVQALEARERLEAREGE